MTGRGWGALVAVLLPASVAALALRNYERRNRALTTQVDAARSAADARAQLVSAVSHDIRAPLAMVKVAADLLDSGSSGRFSNHERRFLTTIADQADQAIAIAEDLLVQVRIEAGKLDTDFTDVDINKLVADTARGLRPLAELRGQRIVTHLPQLSPTFPVDERLIRRAIVNLSTNAMRFTSTGGTVTLRVLHNVDAVVVSVTDDGAGMTAEAREKLFQPFVSGAALADGTGLGLILTREIALLHGGSLLVDTAPRRGTTIMLRLPHRRET